MGKKTIDFETRYDASRERKSKAGGEKIKSDLIIYTPGKITIIFTKLEDCELSSVI